MSDGPETISGIQIAPGVRVREEALRFQFARGAGPGGQNVNKLNTKAELRVRLDDLPISFGAIQRLTEQAGNRITKNGELLLVSDVHRSQEQNRSEVLTRLRELLIAAMRVPKRRRKTKPSRSSREKRLAGKRRRSEVKARRQGRE